VVIGEDHRMHKLPAGRARTERHSCSRLPRRGGQPQRRELRRVV